MAHSRKNEANQSNFHMNDEFLQMRRKRWDYFMNELFNVTLDDDPLYEIDKVEDYENISVKGEKALMMLNRPTARPNLYRSFKINASFGASKGNRTFTFRNKKKRRLDDETNNNDNEHFKTISSLCTTKFDRERQHAKTNVPVKLPSIVLNERVFFMPNKENLFVFASNTMKEQPAFSTFRFNVCGRAPAVQQKPLQNQALTCVDHRKKMRIREERVRSFLEKLRLTDHIDRLMQLFTCIEEWDDVDMRRVVLQKRWLELKDDKNGDKYRDVLQDYYREFSKMRRQLSDNDILIYIKFVLYTYSADLCNKLQRFQRGMKSS